MDWKSGVRFLIARMSEPSSYAGIAALLAAAGVHIDPHLGGAIVNLCIAGAGLAAILFPEKGSKGPGAALVIAFVIPLLALSAMPSYAQQGSPIAPAKMATHKHKRPATHAAALTGADVLVATHPSAAHIVAAAASSSSTSTAPKKQTVSAAAAQKNPLLVLQQFTLSDLQAALADANAQTPPDMVAANCYQALITTLQTPAVNPFPTQAGAFIALQKARDAKTLLANLQSSTGPLSSLNIACAPLVMSVQNTLLQLGVISGAVVGTVASGGLALPLLP